MFDFPVYLDLFCDKLDLNRVLTHFNAKKERLLQQFVFVQLYKAWLNGFVKPSQY